MGQVSANHPVGGKDKVVTIPVTTRRQDDAAEVAGDDA